MFLTEVLVVVIIPPYQNLPRASCRCLPCRDTHIQQPLQISKVHFFLGGGADKFGRGAGKCRPVPRICAQNLVSISFTFFFAGSRVYLLCRRCAGSACMVIKLRPEPYFVY